MEHRLLRIRRMATTQINSRMNSRNKNQQQRSRGRMPMSKKSDGQFGIDDLTYDLVTMLHQKSKGLEAYQKYIQDARMNQDVREMLERFCADDRRKVEELRECLADVLGNDTHAH